MTDTKKPHIHAEIIKAWADGEEIQVLSNCWYDDANPNWCEHNEYRIKPEPKPDVFYFGKVNELYNDHILAFSKFTTATFPSYDNLKLTFDGETGKLKSAEVINS